MASEPEGRSVALADPWRVVVGLHLEQGAVREGSGFKVVCPWCSRGRRTPPCAVRVKEGQIEVHCFACHQGGDVLALIAQVEGFDLQRDRARIAERADELAEQPLGAGAPSPAALRSARPRGKPRLDASSWDRGARGLLELCPLQGSVAVELAALGVLAEAQADGWGELPVNLAKQGPERERDEAEGFDVEAPELDAMLAALDARALRAFVPWLWGASGEVEHPQHRLLIPWRTADQRIWSVQRRWTAAASGEARPGDEPPSLEPLGTAASPAGPYPYGIDAPERTTASEVWIVDGALDVLVLRALNRTGALHRAQQRRSMLALGLPGLGAWSRLREAILPLLAGRRMVLALRPPLLDSPAAQAIQPPAGVSCRSFLLEGAAPRRLRSAEAEVRAPEA